MTVLIPPFQFGCLYLFFLYSDSTMLNKSGESRHPCLVPDLKGKVFACWIYCLLSILLDVGFTYMAFIMLRHTPSIPSLLDGGFFYHKWVLDFMKCFFSIYWYDHVIFVLHFVYVVYYTYWFANIVPSLHPWDEFHLIMVYDLCNVLPIFPH